MAKSDENIAAVLATTGTGGNNPLDSVLKELLVRKLKKEQDIEDETESQQKAARLQNAKTMQKRRDEELAKQRQCPHMKPNFQPAIGGQRDHQGHFHWICAYCAAEWTDNELPVHLHIPADRIGGPQV